jgi:hypothetical protein
MEDLPHNKIERKKEKQENVELKSEHLHHYKMKEIIDSIILTLDDMNEFLPNSFTKIHVLKLGTREDIAHHLYTQLEYVGPKATACFHCTFRFNAIEERNIFFEKKEDDILEKKLLCDSFIPLKDLPSQYENIKGIEATGLVLSWPFNNGLFTNIRLLWTHGNYIHKVYVQLHFHVEKRLELALKMVERVDQIYTEYEF